MRLVRLPPPMSEMPNNDGLDQRSIELNGRRKSAFYPDSGSGLLVATAVKGANSRCVNLEILVLELRHWEGVRNDLL